METLEKKRWRQYENFIALRTQIWELFFSSSATFRLQKSIEDFNLTS